MGEIVRTSCDGCDIDRHDFLGAGIYFNGKTLCACYHCQRLIAKRPRLRGAEPPPAELRCPYCRRVVEELPTFADSDDPFEAPPAEKCPRCGGTLTFEVVGVWD